VRRRMVQSLMAVWVVAQAASASADIVFEQVPNQSSGGVSDTDAYFFGQEHFWEWLADDFQLSEPARITQVAFWGFFYDAYYAPDQETMRIRFLGARDSDGLPDENAVLYSETFQNPAREATGQQVLVGPGPPEYRYLIDLSSPLWVVPNTRYWLEVVQIGDPESDFSWESARTTSPQDVIAGISAVHPEDWTYAGVRFSLAFQLLIPEPNAFGLLIFGFLLSPWRRHRRGVCARSG
jgi:hypothetical protein